MDSSLILSNILNPPVLFFFMGMMAVWLKSANGSVFLLLGSLAVGMVTSENGWDRLEVFTGDIFYGMLTFFLLDIGLVAATRPDDLKKSGSFVIGFSIFMPLVSSLMGIFWQKRSRLLQAKRFCLPYSVPVPPI